VSEFELVFAREFKEDLEHQLDWLDREHPSWIPQLEQELQRCFELLASFPRAGVETRPPMRKLVLTSVPFFFRIVDKEFPRTVGLFRPFHGRQSARQ